MIKVILFITIFIYLASACQNFKILKNYYEINGEMISKAYVNEFPRDYIRKYHQPEGIKFIKHWFTSTKQVIPEEYYIKFGSNYNIMHTFRVDCQDKEEQEQCVKLIMEN